MSTTAEEFETFANSDTEQEQKQDFCDQGIWDDFLKNLSMLKLTEHEWCEQALRTIDPNTCTNIEEALVESARTFVLRVDSEQLKGFPIALIQDSLKPFPIK